MIRIVNLIGGFVYTHSFVPILISSFRFHDDHPPYRHTSSRQSVSHSDGTHPAKQKTINLNFCFGNRRRRRNQFLCARSVPKVFFQLRSIWEHQKTDAYTALIYNGCYMYTHWPVTLAPNDTTSLS